MIQFLLWYLLLTLLGWLTFPLVWRLFPSLGDRGYTLARTFGLLLWSYIFWMLASLGIIRNDSAGILLALLIFLGTVTWASWKNLRRTPQPILIWVRSNARLIIRVEVLFLLAFAAWAFVRASNPEIETAGGEKTMEMAFINAILHSPTFPPHDPWLSGFPISYYYFGYVMTAMLAKITATPAGVAHNLMMALVFSLSFIGMYGLLYNLLEAWRKHKHPGGSEKPSLGLPLLGPLFLLIISNAAGFLEVLHRRGVGWGNQAGGANLWTTLGRLVRPNLEASNFWTWLDIKHLNESPSFPYQWTPDRFIWWWQDSRVIQDYDLVGNFTEIIDEFPAFSYLLGDLHPHVLAMPFLLMAVAFCLNLLMGDWKGQMNLRLYKLPIHPLHFAAGALLLGGLAFLNTWDILLGFALLVGGYVLTRVRESGWSLQRLWDVFAFGVPLGLTAVMLYFPFYVDFSSQAGGILPNLEFPTRGAHLWVMFGTLFPPLLLTLLYLRREGKFRLNWWAGILLGVGFALFLWIFSWMLAFVVQLKMPEFTASYLGTQGFSSMTQFLLATLERRGAFAGGLITLLLILVPAIGFLLKRKPTPAEQEEPAEKDQEATVAETPVDEIITKAEDRSLFAIQVPQLVFILFIILVGTILVLAPEFVYLRDLFGKRMNTIFKFYYQAWMLWSVAAAFGMAVMLQAGSRWWRWISSISLAILVTVGLPFLVFGLMDKTDTFRYSSFVSRLEFARASGDPSPLKTAMVTTWTLDGMRRFRQQYPDDARAADWLAMAAPGVLAEAVGGSYSDFGRMAVYSGQPAVVGWIGHEDQWRGTFEEQRQRGERDIPALYQTSSWEEALAIIQKYEIRYIVVGTLEHRVYRVVEDKFQQYLVPVFQSGEVTIYQVP